MVIHVPESAREFAGVALTVLLEQVGGTARELTRLRGQILDTGELKTPALSGRLSRAARELEREGWLFGLLARELGSDVLFQRRERQGLAYVSWLVEQMLSREGIECWQARVPELDTGDDRCSTICAVVARCVHASQIDMPGARWKFALSGDAMALEFDARPGSGLELALVESSQRLRGSRVCREVPGARLILPLNSVLSE